MNGGRVCADTVGRGCFTLKPETDFNRRGLNRDGTIRRTLLCKSCQAEAQREWEQDNPDRVKEIKTRTYRKHREAVLARERAYREAHRDEINAARRARRDEINARRCRRYAERVERERPRAA
ncbi:MAG TPA: hypothetical protein VFA56_13635 [Gaiellaceae bacterium]|nr:hypothetical protein [Gaiellaceae bacterium]